MRGLWQYHQTFHQNDCNIPEEFYQMIDWLGDSICISVFCPVLRLMMSILPPVILLSNPNQASFCTSLILSDGDTWILHPLHTPSTQRIVVLNDVHSIGSIRLNSLEGRRSVIATCNSSTFYVMTEYETRIKKVTGDQLKENLPGGEISRDRTVIIATFNCTIFSATGPINNGKPDWKEGVELLGVTSVLDSHNLSWSILPADGFGEVYPDGTLEEGKLKWLISTGHADIGFCDFWHNSGVVSDVVNPWHRSCTRLLVPRPRNVHPRWHYVFRPLPSEFWVILIFCTIISAVVIASFTSRSLIRTETDFEKNDYKDSITFEDSVFEAIALMIRGYRNKILNRRSLRIIQATWAIFGVITSAAYSSSLASTLTTPLQEDAPQTLSQLLQRGFVWAAGTEPLTNPEFAFKTQSGVDKEWLKFRVLKHDIVRGRTAILGEELEEIFFMSELESFSKDFIQSLMVSSECLAANHISIMTRKMSPYYEFMSAGFSRLAETGILSKILYDSLKSPRINRYVVKDAYLLFKGKQGGIPLGLGPVRGAFYILIGGELLAICVFFMEIKRFRFAEKKNKSKKQFHWIN